MYDIVMYSEGEKTVSMQHLFIVGFRYSNHFKVARMFELTE